MRLLLDTHCWLWWVAEPERLRKAVRKLIADRHNTILLSAASSWEIAIKYAMGKLPLPEPPEEFVPKRMVRDAMTALPVEHIHALHVASLPAHHRDPFDRLLVAQAQVERIPILTVDRQLERYDVEIVRGA
ncbi:MAG: type II toxin-antitoxin system VapC family toxin [Lentisphaerae bacterium]|nr:type II toxin-antitoxin system VapC family toxin [Lentisphaerota bacterium]